jgi:predicted ATPase
MLTRWTISNFKSIREPITLDLAPLTIFSGINSSGKSTLIQSILLVAQSFQSAVDDEALILNGQYIQLGRLQDVLHYGYDQEFIEVGFHWSPAEDEITSESLEIRLDARIAKGKRRRMFGKRSDKYHPYVTESTIAFAPYRLFHADKVGIKELSVKAEAKPNLQLYSPLPGTLRQRIDEGVFNYVVNDQQQLQLSQESRTERLERVALTNLVPARMLVSVDNEISELIADVEWIIDMIDQAPSSRSLTYENVSDKTLSSQISNVFRQIELSGVTTIKKWESQKTGIARFRHTVIASGSRLSRIWMLRQINQYTSSSSERRELSQMLAAALSQYLRDKRPFSSRSNKISYEERLLPAEYMAAVNQVQKVMGQQVYYLGPLRDEPRVIYSSPPLSEQWDVGLKGEYTAAMLDEYRNFAIAYPLPPGEEFTGHYITKRGSLIDAVTLWLQRMGLIDSIDTEETPKIGYRLTVNSPGLTMSLDLTSVGVGVSQVLPTLVLALLAPVGSILIFEQPELHLHPKVQSVLGDFFLAISMLGKQCLVETHSEHLINRLRRRIVESEEATILPQIRIYFAEKEGAVSQFREVKPNEFGAIVDWPKGFFDESENESSIILKKQLVKRRQANARAKKGKENI